MQNTTDKIASKFLGKRTEGSTNYDPSLILPIPRLENRKQYSISNENLPFIGWDIWHAYEFSAMTENGIPVTRVLKIKYNCDNEFLMESKSLKLYLNSFNMSRFGKTTRECLEICKKTIAHDLSEKLHTNVEVNFLENNSPRADIFSKFQNIMELVDEKNIMVENFKEAPELLEVEESDKQEYYLTFDSLRSNCRVTHQPDFGDAFIYYKSAKHIKEDSLVKYLTSFRSEFHFHEECCEMIFKRLQNILDEGDKLFVLALYTRRGGIDICPSRWTPDCEIKDVYDLIDLNKFARNGIKQ
ncbi:MAG: hypothetical protein NC408_04845 [Candidatus Gastranaerophilales bacterium]|nr:hypothetical protein [Candidatus Gastranaerophilales bacterium]MCM1072805.1 NADPH-dependent 7-cyano-7-deazaguanine reductase QueF [Bacteroides sp.]